MNFVFYVQRRTLIASLEDRSLRRVFGHKREKVKESWRKLYVRSFKICAFHQGLTTDSSEHIMEFSGSIKDREFLEQLSNYPILTKFFDLWS
jgi:hypothetical protein